MANPIFKGSRPKLLLTITGWKDITIEQVTLKVELYSGSYDENSVITLGKSDLKPTQNANEYLVVLSDTAMLKEGTLNVRTTVEYTDSDTGKPVKEINVQQTTLTVKSL